MAKIKHYAIEHPRKIWLAACGLPIWCMAEMWTDKNKVNCKRCKKTKAFKKGL